MTKPEQATTGTHREALNPFSPDLMALNPFAPGFFADPYSHYASLRDAGDAIRTPVGLLIHRYDDCFEVLRTPGTSVDEANVTSSLSFSMLRDFGQERSEPGRRAMSNIDPPDHTRVRRLVSRAFTVRRIEGLRARVKDLVEELLRAVAAEAAEKDSVDLIGSYAFPLPFQVIHEMLGMPDADRDELRAWSHSITRFREPLTTPRELRDVAQASDLMREHVRSAIEWKRRNPADDLLSALIAAEEDGGRLSPEELGDQVRVLYVAGHETTVNLIGNGTLALLQSKAQLRRLADDPALDANAIEELLRYDSPIQFSRRVALADIEIGGETAKPGEVIITLLGAANHDPDNWGPTADELDLSREDAPRHLSFGYGIHYCLGAAMARLVGMEAIPSLVRRFPSMELTQDAPPVWNARRLALRGLESLPVAMTP